MTTCAVLLAAGGGHRFRGDRHKLLTPLRGLPIVVHAASACVRADVGPVIVVTGAAPEVGELVTAAAPDVLIVDNPKWDEGQATSLQRGVATASELGADRMVVGLGDQPFVVADAWRRVAATDAPIAIATYDGNRGNPVLLRSDVWDLLPTTGDRGARAVSAVRPDLVVQVPCDGSPIDIDTVEDLSRWQNSSSTNSP